MRYSKNQKNIEDKVEHFWKLVIMTKISSQFFGMNSFLFKHISDFELRNWDYNQI